MKLSLKSALFEDESDKVSAGDEINITGSTLDQAKIKVVQKMIYQSIKSLTKSDEVSDLLKSYSDKVENKEEISEEENETLKKVIEEFGNKPFGVIDPRHIRTISNKQAKASGPVPAGSRLNPLNIKKNDSQVLGATNYDISKSKNLGGFFILVTSKEGDSISGVSSSKGAFTVAFFVPASGRVLDDNNQEDKKIKELLNTFKQVNGDTNDMYGRAQKEAITLGDKIYYLSILENDLEDFKAAIASNNTTKIITYIKTKANPNVIRSQAGPSKSNESFVCKTSLKNYLFESEAATMPDTGEASTEESTAEPADDPEEETKTAEDPEEETKTAEEVVVEPEPEPEPESDPEPEPEEETDVETDVESEEEVSEEDKAHRLEVRDESLTSLHSSFFNEWYQTISEDNLTDELKGEKESVDRLKKEVQDEIDNGEMVGFGMGSLGTIAAGASAAVLTGGLGGIAVLAAGVLGAPVGGFIGTSLLGKKKKEREALNKQIADYKKNLRAHKEKKKEKTNKSLIAAYNQILKEAGVEQSSKFIFMTPLSRLLFEDINIILEEESGDSSSEQEVVADATNTSQEAETKETGPATKKIRVEQVKKILAGNNVLFFSGVQEDKEMEKRFLENLNGILYTHNKVEIEGIEKAYTISNPAAIAAANIDESIPRGESTMSQPALNQMLKAFGSTGSPDEQANPGNIMAMMSFAGGDIFKLMLMYALSRPKDFKDIASGFKDTGVTLGDLSGVLSSNLADFANETGQTELAGNIPEAVEEAVETLQKEQSDESSDEPKSETKREPISDKTKILDSDFNELRTSIIHLFGRVKSKRTEIIKNFKNQKIKIVSDGKVYIINDISEENIDNVLNYKPKYKNDTSSTELKSLIDSSLNDLFIKADDLNDANIESVNSTTKKLLSNLFNNVFTIKGTNIDSFIDEDDNSIVSVIRAKNKIARALKLKIISEIFKTFYEKDNIKFNINKNKRGTLLESRKTSGDLLVGSLSEHLFGDVLSEGVASKDKKVNLEAEWLRIWDI